MQILFFGLFKFSPFRIFSYLPPCEGDGAQTVLPSGADLCRRVERQPDTFLSLRSRVIHLSRTRPGRHGTCESFGMRLHTGTARRTATRPVLEETLDGAGVEKLTAKRLESELSSSMGRRGWGS
jgi:hypothetical protein